MKNNLMDSELDKLRDKTLSFGCIVHLLDDDGNPEVDTYFDHLFIGGKHEKIDIYSINTQDNGHWRISHYATREKKRDLCIIGRPIDRGRICHLFADYGTEYCKMYDLLIENGLMGQNELQRMQHEKRPELKNLLKQFSDYL